MSNFSKQDLQKIKELLKVKSKIVITSHHNPDGDAIGSVLGLYHILKGFGVESRMVIPNDTPDFLNWLPGSKEVVHHSKNKEKAAKLIEDAEVIFALDYNGPSRLEALSKTFEQSKAVKILIDHHPNPEDGFNHYFSEIKSSSTAELIFEFALLLDGDHLINRDAAINIFVGIMTDTGSFSYGCSNPRTFEIVANLIDKGVVVEDIQQKVYNNFSEHRMRLLGHSLSTKMKVFPEYSSAYISLTKDELKQFKYSPGDTEGLVNYPLSIKGIVFSALFVENTNYVKVSLRSKGEFPVNKVSEKFFNGGGHMNAAGGKSFKSMEETEKDFMEVIEKFKNQLNQ